MNHHKTAAARDLPGPQPAQDVSENVSTVDSSSCVTPPPARGTARSTSGDEIGQAVGMDREDRQDLHYRAADGDVLAIRARLAAGVVFGLADKQGFTALHFAAQQSQTDAVRTLLEAGAPVDPRDRYGNTQLLARCVRLERTERDCGSAASGWR